MMLPEQSHMKDSGHLISMAEYCELVAEYSDNGTLGYVRKG